MTLLVVVQRICVEWSKEARGRQLATRRAQVPKTFILPSHNLKPSTSALVQVVNFNEEDGFAKARESFYEYDEIISFRLAEFEIKLEDEALRLTHYLSNPLRSGSLPKHTKTTELNVSEVAQYE